MLSRTDRSDLSHEGLSRLESWSWTLHLLVTGAETSISVMRLSCLSQQVEIRASETCTEGSFFAVYKYGYTYNKLQLLDEWLMLKML